MPDGRIKQAEAAEVPPQYTNRIHAVFCLHCGSTLTGRYCHDCGQKAIGERLTIKSVLLETFKQVSRLDEALVRTFTTLFRYPAEVTVAYLVGQRNQFVAPVRYMIVLLATEFTTAALFKWIMSYIDNPGADVWLEHTGRGYVLRFAQVFVMASLWRGLFRSSGYNVAEMYAMGLYVLAQITALNVMMNVLVVAFPFFPHMSWMEALAIQSTIDFCYLLFATKGFFGEDWKRTTIKLLASFALPLLLFWGAVRTLN